MHPIHSQEKHIQNLSLPKSHSRDSLLKWDGTELTGNHRSVSVLRSGYQTFLNYSRDTVFGRQLRLPNLLK